MDPTVLFAEIKKLARKHPRAVVVTHDHPDPDAMAAAAGLAFLLTEELGVPTRVAYGGIIGRAENQAVARLLKSRMVPLSRVHFRQDDLVALVDTQPEHGNHSLPPDVLPSIVVDHHPLRESTRAVSVPLVSDAHGATSSIVTELLRAAKVDPPVELATALFYGLKTDTLSLSREAEAADYDAHQWLDSRKDPALLARIENPLVPRRWFEAFHRAFDRARIHGDVVLADIGDVYVPDIVPEVAERLMCLEGVKWAVAIGVWDAQVYVSVRTDDGRMNAGKRLQACLSDLGGSAGGHGKMAGARLSLEALPYRDARRRVSEISEALRREFGAVNATPVPLIDRMEAIQDARESGSPEPSPSRASPKGADTGLAG